MSARDLTCKTGSHFPFSDIFIFGGQEISTSQYLTFIHYSLANTYCAFFFSEHRNPSRKQKFCKYETTGKSTHLLGKPFVDFHRLK